MNLKNFIINSGIILISIFFALAIVELFLRINNQDPWGNLDSLRNDPTINKPSEKLGWEPKEGKYKFKAFTKEGEDFEINILSDGSRKVSYKNNKQKDQIVFLGGSITLGWGVNDEQTFVSQLQKKINNYDLKNFSAGGYGTYQSFLRLENILKKNEKIKIVILSYLPHHSIRNIGSEFWLRTLTKYSRRGYVKLPYASIGNNGELVRMEPISYFKIPLMDHISILNKISKRIMKNKLKNNETKSIEVTNSIFINMSRLLKEKKIKFFILNLSDRESTLQPYFDTINTEKISIINCNFDAKDNLIIKGDGHPNHLMHSLYSDCILRNLNM